MSVDLVSKNTFSKRILIFGIDSFTGTHLSDYLEDLGYDVYGTSYLKSNKKKFKCDIRNKEDILTVLDKVKPNFIIQMAGISFPAHGNSSDFYEINTIGAINILDALIELNLNPKRVILVSSATVYGNQGIEILDESLCPTPANHYGASKYAMESLAKNYFSKLNIIITRPFNYTGAGQAEHFLIPKIIKHFKEKKESIELGNLDVIREFNGIKYICEVYSKLLTSNSTSIVVNLASNRGIKLLDVINMMQEIAGYNIEIKVNPAFVRKDEIKKLTGSSQKLFGLIGEVKQRDFELTLRDMFEA
ncbi:MAG: GDP-mannose 4,6-dehydratase [Sulfurovaceae bacterium]|nr:GDP-mannose 4,6-dehydratase [Sulfurovaceae bacterium]